MKDEQGRRTWKGPGREYPYLFCIAYVDLLSLVLALLSIGRLEVR